MSARKRQGVRPTHERELLLPLFGWPEQEDYETIRNGEARLRRNGLFGGYSGIRPSRDMAPRRIAKYTKKTKKRAKGRLIPPSSAQDGPEAVDRQPPHEEAVEEHAHEQHDQPQALDLDRLRQGPAVEHDEHGRVGDHHEAVEAG